MQAAFETLEEAGAKLQQWLTLMLSHCPDDGNEGADFCLQSPAALLALHSSKKVRKLSS